MKGAYWGIKGWVRTLELNEELKNDSEKLLPNELFTSPLTPKVRVGVSADEFEELKEYQQKYGTVTLEPPLLSPRDEVVRYFGHYGS